ncbi:tripartite tricarboxylate transporter substrate binding protein [Roseibacterium sp. SDUM158016]|uniref:Bug family tripartite tricarboxylate transporter substrate binding protein n=1 Tax=Roseicyclus sediminis TaxID=2980997 RepID=UPI0021D2CBA6|nr:tripartite tricarboxylate transporter substrate binding protein [Roseibacterium sp. SDUM158016]MCU4652700.1 tripartite tricarboxylate transporter substrate binding protein [Roseibacterium sp. SDUM158016]
MSINLIRSVALGLAVASVAIPASAQDTWPTGPVHVYVGFPAGSSPDTLARIITDPLAQRLGQPIVVENRPGAGGVIGIQQMLAAAGDGHTFGTTINGPMTTAQRMMDDTGYDVSTDILPVTLIATSPLVLAVSSASEITDVAGFIAAAGAEPQAIAYGSVGQGSGAHLTAELFAAEAGVEMLHVPFTSYAEVTTSIMGGEIDAGFMAPSAALPHVQGGNMRMLGITSSEPFPQAPDVPVLAGQAGLPADFRAELWNAFIAPAGTDPAVVERLNTEINDILSDPAVQEQLLAIGWNAAPGTPGDLAERIVVDTAMWGAVIDRVQAQQ